EVRAVIELVAVVAAGRVGRSGDGDALRGLGERLVILQLAHQPAVGDVVVEYDRVAAIRVGSGGATVLAQPAEAGPDGVDGRGAELQRAILLAVHRDGDVHHLHVLRG